MLSHASQYNIVELMTTLSHAPATRRQPIFGFYCRRITPTPDGSISWHAPATPTATGNPPATISARHFNLLASGDRLSRRNGARPEGLFPVIQRWHGDFRVFCVGVMHRLGIVPQRLLREPLRVPAALTASSPAMTSRARCHAIRLAS